MNRRNFLFNMSIGAASMAVSGLSTSLYGLDKGAVTKLTILHTNDVHSRLDPFPNDGTKLAGMGGAARRTALVKQIREVEDHVLLFDCGDIVQGTPYFNMFEGKPEYELMSMMKYDAATLGNHDFDSGVAQLAKLQAIANFPMINTNYDMSNTPMHGLTHPYKIFKKADIKIGVLGLGIDLDGLVTRKQSGEINFLDTIQSANKTATFLKKDQKCDLVICLSHLGYKYKNPALVSDLIVAAQTRDIDIILGGHTHTFLDKPDMVKNLDNEIVLVNQVGWAGMRLGRIDVHFERNKKGNCVSCDNIWVRN